MKQKRIRAICSIWLLLIVISYHLLLADSGLGERPHVVLENNIVRFEVDLFGGSIVDFQFLDQNLNPFTWNYPEKGDLKPRDMGHLLCFDRWGAPSPQEIKNGMPYHGEATHVEWQVLSQPMSKDGKVNAELLCELPMAGLTLKRFIALSENAPVVTVREEINNINKLGRIYNIIEHSTISPPFLDESVLVDTNAKKGFMQESPLPDPEEPVVYWPYIAYKGNLVNLRQLKDDPLPSLVSFVFAENDEYCWVAACNPGKGLLLGYIWGISDYPWLSFWRYVKDGGPKARGLEFGTTGLHRPYPILVAKGKIFNRPLYEYIDAGQTIVKSYTMFLTRIPHDYKGVKDLTYKNGTIVLKEHDSDESRNITISTE